MSSKLKFLAGLSVVVAAVTACTEPKAKSKLAQDLPAGNKIEFFDDVAKEFMTGVTEYNEKAPNDRTVRCLGFGAIKTSANSCQVEAIACSVSTGDVSISVKGKWYAFSKLPLTCGMLEWEEVQENRGFRELRNIDAGVVSRNGNGVVSTGYSMSGSR